MPSDWRVRCFGCLVVTLATVVLAVFSATQAWRSYRSSPMSTVSPPAPGEVTPSLSTSKFPPDGPEVKLYLRGTNTKSAVELPDRKRTILLVQVPSLGQPVDRLIFGTVVVRTVNIGTKSIQGCHLVTDMSKELWGPALQELEKDGAVPITADADLDMKFTKDNEGWVVSRNLPRLDPNTGAPYLIAFFLEFSGAKSDNSTSQTPIFRCKQADGEIKFTLRGLDWTGLSHALAIRAVTADSQQEFVDTSRSLVESLRAQGPLPGPVVLAATSKPTVIGTGVHPQILHVSLETFFALDESRSN